MDHDLKMEIFRIALAQLEPALFDKQANLAKARQAIQHAADQGASAIIFPELYLSGYSLAERALEMAETLEGDSVKTVADMAYRYQIAILMGFPEIRQNRRQVFDSVCIVDARGNILGSYQKAHLFHDETGWFRAGDKLGVVDFGLGPTGILICYDLEFPEAVRALALKGAKWIATCTGNMAPNQHLQETFIQARAAENHLWVAVANRVGNEGSLEFFGGSAASDPAGRLTALAGNTETILLVDIDLGVSKQAVENADYLSDRRPELYD